MILWHSLTHILLGPMCFRNWLMTPLLMSTGSRESSSRLQRRP